MLRYISVNLAAAALAVACGDSDGNAAPEPASSGRADLQVETLLEGRDVIWGLAFLPDGRLLFTEKKGTMGILDPSSKKVTTVSGVPAAAVHGQGGLLDVALHPGFAKNGLIYFTRAKKVAGGYTTALARARLQGDKLVDVGELFEAKPASDAGQHFGSRIAIPRDGGHVYFTVGDRGERNNAQDLGVHPGKVLRLTAEGKIPEDNPFVGRAGALPEIWTYGNRNIQGMAFHPETGELWAHEHGPRGGDELNKIEKGKNYGWPVVTFGREYHGPRISDATSKPGIQDPVHQYTPSIGPSGLSIYVGDSYPGWKGAFLIGALALEHFNVLTFPGKAALGSGKEERLLLKARERIRDVRTGPDSLVYLSTDSGKILKLVPNRGK